MTPSAMKKVGQKLCYPCWIMLIMAGILLALLVYLLFVKTDFKSFSGIKDSGQPLPVLPVATVIPFFPDTSIPPKNQGYTCPPSGWIDCMPGPGAPKPFCQPDYIKWAENNCPDFGGVAY